MGIAATVYAEELSTYGYGHPLWCPEPIQRKDGTYRHIHLGDVGFVDEDGGFRSLFNTTVDAHHELNSAGVPKGFVPVDFNDNHESVREGFLQPQPLCSETVRAHAASADASVNVTTVAGGNLAYTFKCSSHRGAFLLIDDHATKTSFLPDISFKRYMLDHHASWYAFATDPKKFGLQCEPEDIVLVRGTMKTSSWRIGAFFGQTSRSHRLAAGAQVASVGGANLQMSSEYNQSHKWEQRVDPHRALPRPPIIRLASAPDDAMDVDSVDSGALINQPPVKDQCIFLNYYKIKLRKFLPKKIIANADPPFLDEEASDGGGNPVAAGMDPEVELDSDNISPHVPLDDLLDYILEHSNARVAIASGTDIEILFQGCCVPRNLAATLREQQPRIDIDHYLEAGHIVTNSPRKIHSSSCSHSRQGSTSRTGQRSRSIIRHQPALRSDDEQSEACPSDQHHNGLDEVSRAIFQHSGKPTAFQTACVACRKRTIKCSGTIPCTQCCILGEKDACVEAPSRQRRKIRSTPVGAATQKPSSTTENFESRRKRRKLTSVDEALTDAGASVSDENPKSDTPSKSGRFIRWVRPHESPSHSEGSDADVAKVSEAPESSLLPSV